MHSTDQTFSQPWGPPFNEGLINGGIIDQLDTDAIGGKRKKKKRGEGGGRNGDRCVGDGIG